MGMQTTIFFTFWGLFALVKDDKRITGDNWMQKMVAMMDRPGIDHLKLGTDELRRGRAGDDEAPREGHQVASPGELLEAPSRST